MPGEEIIAYRLVAPRWAHTPLSGEGARLFGGRWNSPGRPCLYLAGSRALAALEVLVHLPTPESRKASRILLEIAFPKDRWGDSFQESLGWDSQPPIAASQKQGDQWLSMGSRLAMTAPSVIMPEEKNYLLNPLHPFFEKARLVSSRPFTFDRRLDH